MAGLAGREAPVLLDLGPVIGGNVSFFGERLGCKIVVEDIAKDIDRHVTERRLAELPRFFETRIARRRERGRYPVLGPLRLPGQEQRGALARPS